MFETSSLTITDPHVYYWYDSIADYCVEKGTDICKGLRIALKWFFLCNDSEDYPSLELMSHSLKEIKESSKALSHLANLPEQFSDLFSAIETFCTTLLCLNDDDEGEKLIVQGSTLFFEHLVPLMKALVELCDYLITQFQISLQIDDLLMECRAILGIIKSSYSISRITSELLLSEELSQNSKLKKLFSLVKQISTFSLNVISFTGIALAFACPPVSALLFSTTKLIVDFCLFFLERVQETFPWESLTVQDSLFSHPELLNKA